MRQAFISTEAFSRYHERCFPTDPMARLLFSLPLLCLFILPLRAQSPAQAESASWPERQYLVSGGYSWLSNAPNGLPGSHQPLNGWDASAAIPAWRHLRFKVDTSGYRGVNLGAQQHALFILGGGQYDLPLRRESLFGEAMFGVGNMNLNWGPNGLAGETASAAAQLGGGFDLALARRLAIRVQGDYQYSYFSLSGKRHVPYRIPGLPTNFIRFTTGLVVRL